MTSRRRIEALMGLAIPVALFALCSLTNADKTLDVTFIEGDSGKDRSAFKKFVKQYNLDVWSMDHKSATVRVSKLEEKLLISQFNTTVQVENLERLIRKQIRKNKRKNGKEDRYRAFRSPIRSFAKYRRIMKWLIAIAHDYRRFVSFLRIGKTYRGLQTGVVRIGTGNETKPAVFIMAGLHGREWLAVSTVVYVINKLFKGMVNGDPRITALIEQYDFYILPVANPDSYTYTFRGIRSRLWRKTRSKHENGCHGVDPNRNFDVDFERGQHTNPCSYTYPGPRPFSEKCTSNIRDFVMSSRMKDRIRLFYDVHAFGQYYLVPFSYSDDVVPYDDEEVRRVARVSNKALFKVNGRRFNIGTAEKKLMYRVAGGAVDWFKKIVNVSYCYNLEVAPRSGTATGFLSEIHEILPSGREITEAILTATEEIYER